MTLHPSAWVAWLAAVAVFAFAVTNPFHLVLGLGAAAVVHASLPAEPSPARRAVATFVRLGVILLVVRLLFVALLTNPGRTVLFTLPRFDVPAWLGGFGAGGPVTAEVLTAAAIDGARLVLVLAAFGVFNAHADLAALVRSVPSAFRDMGLVVAIAVAFVPGMMRAVRDVSEARRLRGERGRVALSMAVPVLGLGLERAFLLAESMDARGYGRGEASRPARASLWAGLVAMLGSTAVWAAGLRALSTALVAGGAAAVAWSLRSTSRRATTTRLQIRPPRTFDVAVIVASAVAAALALAAGPAVVYDPYPAVSLPAFDAGTAATTFLVAFPALAGARG